MTCHRTCLLTSNSGALFQVPKEYNSHISWWVTWALCISLTAVHIICMEIYFLCLPAVAPICYAHLAAAQVGQFIKFDEMSETSSSHGEHTSAGSVPVQELPRLHDKVRSSMFFCWAALAWTCAAICSWCFLGGLERVHSIAIYHDAFGGCFRTLVVNYVGDICVGSMHLKWLRASGRTMLRSVDVSSEP